MDLLDLAPRQRWSALSARAKSHPHEIAARDSTGLTPLHWTCFNQPPAFAVRALLENEVASDGRQSSGSGEAVGGGGNGARGGAAYRSPPPALLATDVHGTTPLHAACSSHASSAVVSTLVAACPSAVLSRDRSGWTPLHYACGTAFASTFGPDGSDAADDALGVVDTLIGAEPTCVDCVDGEGQTPLGLLCGVMGRFHDPNWRFSGRRERRGRPSSSGTVESATSGSTSEEESVCEEWFWSVAKLLVRTSYRLSRKPSVPTSDNVVEVEATETIRHGVPPILHQLASMQSSIPDELVEYCIARHPEQALLADDDGNLPLHLAAATSPVNDHIDLMAKLLSAHPSAVRVTDGQGRLPLQTAILTGRTWDQGVYRLLVAYPEALQTCGLDCAAYPSLLGRIAMQSKDGESTTVLFGIIRSKPDLCCG